MSNMNKVDFDDKTTIYEYFKEHNSLLIASISGILAFISFYVGVLSYISTRIYLNEYNIRSDMIQINSQGSLFYMVIAYMFYFISITVSIFIVKNAIHQRDVNLAAKLYLSITSKNNYDMTEERRKETRYYTFVHIFPCIILIICAVLLLELTSSYITWSTLALILTIVLFVCIYAYLSERKNNKSYRIKEIEKRIARIMDEKKSKDENDEDVNLMIKDVVDISNSLNNRGKITNEHVTNCIILIVIAMFVSFVYVVSSSYRDTKDQKKYSIYNENDKQYAVIYQNEKIYILEQIEINGDDLIVYRNKQRYLASDDLNVERRYFKNVNKVDATDNRQETQLTEGQFEMSSGFIGEDNKVDNQDNNE